MDENNQNITNSNERKVIKISRKKLVMIPIVLVVLLAAAWFVLHLISNTFSVGPARIREQAVPCIPNPISGITCDDSYGGNYDVKINNGLGGANYYSNEPTIEDTREFLKTNYRSTIKTRDVSNTVTSVKNIVAGSDGRVDGFNSSEKYGYVSFIVAKSKFENLRNQIEKITHKKLYTENVSAQNLLGQKQNIEQQQSTSLDNLGNLNTQLTNLTSVHNQTVTYINQQLNSIKNQLTSLRANIAVTTDANVLVSLRNQETLLMQQQSTQNTKLDNENKTYQSQKTSLESQINSWNNNLTNVNKQDIAFANNIETVNGYVTVDWVSYWDMIKIYSPIHPTFIIIILIIIAIVLFRKNKRLPKIILE